VVSSRPCLAVSFDGGGKADEEATHVVHHLRISLLELVFSDPWVASPQETVLLIRCFEMRGQT
jgi:hypothetical protein